MRPGAGAIPPAGRHDRAETGFSGYGGVSRGLPGGWLGPNESPEAGVIREVAEETGLAVEVVRLGAVCWRSASLPAAPHGQVGLVYVCRVTGGELRRSHESLELAWRDPADPGIRWHLDHRTRAYAALENRPVDREG